MNVVSNEKRPETSYFNGFLRQADRCTNFPRFQGAQLDHVRVQSSRCCFPRASLILFALGRHWVLTNGTWHVLLQSGNVFELGGITTLYINYKTSIQKSLCGEPYCAFYNPTLTMKEKLSHIIVLHCAEIQVLYFQCLLKKLVFNQKVSEVWTR